MSEDKKPFSVSDRRHFTPEGEVRKPGDEEAPAGGPEPAPSASTATASQPEPPAPAREAEETGPRFPSDFIGLLISLGAQASMLLMGGPEGEPPDLESARALIELLSSLKEKTEGRRTPQEDQLLDGLLYELRMGYVQATKGGAR